MKSPQFSISCHSKFPNTSHQVQESGGSRSRALKLKLPQNCNRNTKIVKTAPSSPGAVRLARRATTGAANIPDYLTRITEQHYFGAGGRRAGERQWKASGHHASGWQLLCWPKADAAARKSLGYLPVKSGKRKPQQSLLVLCQELAEPINLFPPHFRVQNAVALYVLGQPRICEASQLARGQVPVPLTQPQGTSPACRRWWTATWLPTEQKGPLSREPESRDQDTDQESQLLEGRKIRRERSSTFSSVAQVCTSWRVFVFFCSPTPTISTFEKTLLTC